MQESNSFQDLQLAIASLTSNESAPPHVVEDILGPIATSIPTHDQFVYFSLNDNNDPFAIDFDCGQFLAEVVPSTPSRNDDVPLSSPPPASADADADAANRLSSSNTINIIPCAEIHTPPMTITDDQTKNYSNVSQTPNDNYRTKGNGIAMSPADELKLRKRESNKESARRSRKRKEELMAELEETNKRIKYEHEHMKDKFNNVLKENKQLKAIAQEYAQLKASFHNLVRENEPLKHWSIRISGGPMVNLNQSPDA